MNEESNAPADDTTASPEAPGAPPPLPKSQAKGGLIRHWEAANASWDPDQRRRHLNETMTRFRELLPVTVLLADVQSSVAHRRVKGLRTPDRGDVVEFLSELWIEADPIRR